MVLKIKITIPSIISVIALQSLIFNSSAKSLSQPLQRTPKIDNSLVNSDWVNQQRNFSPCPGFYERPILPTVTTPEIAADSSSLAKNGLSKLNGNVEFLDKDQKVTADKATAYRDEKLKKVTQITLQDNVQFVSPNFRAVTSLVSADLLTNTATFNSDIYYRYYQNNAHGQAKRAIVIKDSSYNIFDAMYTTCPPNENYNAWQLNASEINIDPNKQVGTAWNTVLYFYDLPIFYSPYISFPTSKERKSGLLLPTYNRSDTYGYSIAQPYYLNLAPNYDATLTTRYMTLRDAQFQIETRYLDSYGSNYINFEILPDDKAFAKFKKDNLTSPPEGLTYDDPKIKNLKNAPLVRHAIRFKDNKQWNNNFSSTIDYNYFSDNQYVIDLPPSELLHKQSEDHFLQQALINYSSDTWQASALVKGYQTMHSLNGPALTEPYKILPGITLSNNNLINSPVSLTPNINPVLNMTLDANAMHFVKPSHPATNKTANGQRYFVKPAISASLKETYGYITPKLALHSRVYNLTRLNENAEALHYKRQQDYVIPIASIDGSLYFDRLYEFNNQKYNQTLEPRLFYLFVPNKKQHQAPDFDIKENTFNYEQLFRDNRFSGFDRQSNANQLSAGLVSRLQNKSSGAQYLKLGLGQVFYFQDMITTICDQKTSLNCIETEIHDYNHRLSPFISELNINFDPKVYGQAEWQWDYYTNKTRKVNLGLHYADQHEQNAHQTLINLEYNFLKEGNTQYSVNGRRIFLVNKPENNLSEIEASFKFPVRNNWNILGFTSYDLTDQSTLDNYLGIEYQQCCWAIRFGYKNQLRLRVNSEAAKKYDNIYKIQFSLKGLGEINQSFENILRSNIPGYYNHLTAIY